MPSTTLETGDILVSEGDVVHALMERGRLSGKADR